MHRNLCENSDFLLFSNNQENEDKRQLQHPKKTLSHHTTPHLERGVTAVDKHHIPRLLLGRGQVLLVCAVGQCCSGGLAARPDPPPVPKPAARSAPRRRSNTAPESVQNIIVCFFNVHPTIILPNVSKNTGFKHEYEHTLKSHPSLPRC